MKWPEDVVPQIGDLVRPLRELSVRAPGETGTWLLRPNDLGMITEIESVGVFGYYVRVRFSGMATFSIWSGQLFPLNGLETLFWTIEQARRHDVIGHPV